MFVHLTTADYHTMAADIEMHWLPNQQQPKRAGHKTWWICAHGHELYLSYTYLKYRGHCTRCGRIAGWYKNRKLETKKRACIDCGTVLKLKQFFITGYRKDGTPTRSSRCYSCEYYRSNAIVKQRQKRQKNPLQFVRYNDKYRLQRQNDMTVCIQCGQPWKYRATHNRCRKCFLSLWICSQRSWLKKYPSEESLRGFEYLSSLTGRCDIVNLPGADQYPLVTLRKRIINQPLNIKNLYWGPPQKFKSRRISHEKISGSTRG